MSSPTTKHDWVILEFLYVDKDLQDRYHWKCLRCDLNSTSSLESPPGDPEDEEDLLGRNCWTRVVSKVHEE